MPFGAAHWPYLVLLLVIVLVIWGPGKLPDLGSGMGRAIREFRKASTDATESAATRSTEPAALSQAPVAATPATGGDQHTS